MSRLWRAWIMPLPDLTHLQFLVLTTLLEGEQTGRYIRERLADEGQRKTGPAFYQMMARLEDSGLVKGWYDQRIIEGQIIKERRYKLTATGERAWAEVRDFYLAHGKLGFQGVQP
jgi:DNA-binding PadR family transcriptional regulator